jgi:hypothetical protein
MGDTPAAGNIRLHWLVAKGRVGEPIELGEVETGPAEPTPGGYRVPIRQRRRWETGMVSESRLGRPSVGVANGVVEGDVWCRAEDIAAARAALTAGVRSLLEGMVASIRASLDSLPAADAAPSSQPR